MVKFPRKNSSQRSNDERSEKGDLHSDLEKSGAIRPNLASHLADRVFHHLRCFWHLTQTGTAGFLLTRSKTRRFLYGLWIETVMVTSLARNFDPDLRVLIIPPVRAHRVAHLNDSFGSTTLRKWNQIVASKMVRGTDVFQ